MMVAPKCISLHSGDQPKSIQKNSIPVYQVENQWPYPLIWIKFIQISYHSHWELTLKLYLLYWNWLVLPSVNPPSTLLSPRMWQWVDWIELLYSKTQKGVTILDSKYVCSKEKKVVPSNRNYAKNWESSFLSNYLLRQTIDRMIIWGRPLSGKNVRFNLLTRIIWIT